MENGQKEEEWVNGEKEEGRESGKKEGRKRRERGKGRKRRERGEVRREREWGEGTVTFTCFVDGVGAWVGMGVGRKVRETRGDKDRKSGNKLAWNEGRGERKGPRKRTERQMKRKHNLPRTFYTKKYPIFNHRFGDQP